MMGIRRELGRQLSSFDTRTQVRRKLVWLARYFNSVLEKTPIEGVVPFLKQYIE